MSGGFPLELEVANGSSAGISAGTGTTLTGAASAYGSLVQLTASTASDAQRITLYSTVITNSLSNNFYITVMIGAAGSEVAIISDFYMCFDAREILTFPLQIPAGTRISAKLWSDGGTDTFKLGIGLFDSAFSVPEGYAGVESVVGAAPNITGNNASGTSGTYGSWAQVVASTSRDYKGLIPFVAGPSGNVFTGCLFQIGVGGAGSEVAILPDQMAINFSGGTRGAVSVPFIPYPVPKGTRLSFQTTVSGTVAINNRMALMGVF
jgi:hypothetical protein